MARTVAMFEIQLSRRVIINYSVARHLPCTPLCYANVYTMIERYRVHATRNYSIRRRIISYVSGERGVNSECINKVFYCTQKYQFLINHSSIIPKQCGVSRIHYVKIDKITITLGKEILIV